MDAHLDSTQSSVAMSKGPKSSLCNARRHVATIRSCTCTSGICGTRQSGPRNPGQRRTLARADPRGPVTMSDRPEDRPVPPPARASARNARTRRGTDGRDEHLAWHPRRQTIATRSAPRSGRPARKMHGAHESRMDFRSGSKIRKWSRRSPRSCGGHRAKAPAMKRTRRHKPPKRRAAEDIPPPLFRVRCGVRTASRILSGRARIAA